MRAAPKRDPTVRGPCGAFLLALSLFVLKAEQEPGQCPIQLFWGAQGKAQEADPFFHLLTSCKGRNRAFGPSLWFLLPSGSCSALGHAPNRPPHSQLGLPEPRAQVHSQTAKNRVGKAEAPCRRRLQRKDAVFFSFWCLSFSCVSPACGRDKVEI